MIIFQNIKKKNERKFKRNKKDFGSGNKEIPKLRSMRWAQTTKCLISENKKEIHKWNIRANWKTKGKRKRCVHTQSDWQ